MGYLGYLLVCLKAVIRGTFFYIISEVSVSYTELIMKCL